MTGFLQKIYSLTTERVSTARAETPLAALQDAEFYARRPQDPLPAFRTADCHVIAEVKFASPSEGDIRADTDATKIAAGYLSAGARMLSVLTEPLYFKGHPDYLRDIRRENSQALLLRKDFIADEYQLHEARAMGADAILLIAAMTEPALTLALLQAARALGLAALVEVHDAPELEMATRWGADFIGVNNRNLKTLKTDIGISHALARQKPADAVFISESGLKTAQDLHDLQKAGYDGFLMGTHFMRQKNPGAALAAMITEVEACV